MPPLARLALEAVCKELQLVPVDSAPHSLWFAYHEQGGSIILFVSNLELMLIESQHFDHSRKKWVTPESNSLRERVKHIAEVLTKHGFQLSEPKRGWREHERRQRS